MAVIVADFDRDSLLDIAVANRNVQGDGTLGDGVNTCDADCDDGDPDRFPGNPEVCDGKNNDCDTVIDSGLDDDGDGDSVACNVDCNDFDASSWAVRSEAHSLIINVVTDVLSWNEPLAPGSVGGVQYDVIRSSNGDQLPGGTLVRTPRGAPTDGASRTLPDDD